MQMCEGWGGFHYPPLPRSWALYVLLVVGLQRGPLSLVSTLRSYLEEKVAVPV
jgi:hypothetical protein